jgi:hypothetical protein
MKMLVQTISNVFLNKCWCDSFKKILVQLFMKNISSTFYLKNIVTFLN